MKRLKNKESLISGDGGFTLIELLLAVALMAVVLVALYGTMFSVITGQKRIESELERTRELRRFMDIITMEIRSAYFDDKNTKTLFDGEMNNFRGRTLSRLSFTSFTYPVVGSSTGPTTDLMAIEYFVEEDPDVTGILYKVRSNPYADREDGYTAEVMDGVESFELSYYDGKDWVKAWNALRETKLPKAVKVVLKLNDEGRLSELSTIGRIAVGEK